MRDGSERSPQRGANRYTKIVESIFHAKYEAGQTHVDFEREEDLRRYGERLAD